MERTGAVKRPGNSFKGFSQNLPCFSASNAVDCLPNVTTLITSSFATVSWPLRILYADDMPELRRLMRHMLALDGHVVETVEDGEEALLLVNQSVAMFDVIITDHHMPKIDGLEFVRRIRKLPYAGKLVVFSSELSEAVNDEYRRFKVDLILAKPVFPSTFRNRLRELFGRSEPANSRHPGSHARLDRN